MTPLVTIFIAAYNQARFIEASLQSALNQSFPKDRYEILVINDGSTDDTSSILAKYGEVVRVLHQSNQGLAATCNRGISEARGDYFVRLDSDDMLSPLLLSMEAERMDDEPDIVGVYSDRFTLYEDKEEMVKLSGNDLFEMVACGVMMRTNHLRILGGYRSVFWEEYDLFLRMLDAGQFRHIPHPLYRYRRHGSNMTNNRRGRREGWLQLLELHGKEKLMHAGEWKRIDELRKVLGN